jgi:hypothetical protein
MNELVTLLTSIQLSTANEEWRCHHATGEVFSVSSCYRYLSGTILPPISLDSDVLFDLGKLWKSLAPSKVIVFSWQLLRRRLPTKENLSKRDCLGVGPNTNCAWCLNVVESERHLFGNSLLLSCCGIKLLIGLA